MDFLHLSGKKHPQIDLSSVVFSDYVIKINYRGKCQKRTLIITPTTIYNCKPSGLRVKRTIPISDVENFTLSSSSNNFILATKTGYDYNLNYKNPKALVDIISKQIHPKEFSIYFVDKTSLLEYTRTATKHKQINKRRKNINTSSSSSPSSTNATATKKSGVVYKMPSSAQVQKIFKEKEALLLFFGIIKDKEEELNAIEMWNKILKLKEKQNLNGFDNFLQLILNNESLKGDERKKFVQTLKGLLIKHHFVSATDVVTKHLNDLTSSNKNTKEKENYVKEDIKKLQIPIGLNSSNDTRKPSRTAANIKLGGVRPTIHIQGLNNFKLSINPLKQPSINNKSKNNLNNLSIGNRPAIDLTQKISPSTKQTLNVPSHTKQTNTNSASLNKKKFRKLHLKEQSEIALENSIFMTTPKQEIEKLSNLLINSNLEPLFLVGFKDPNLTLKKEKKDKKEKKNKTTKKEINGTIKGEIKASKFTSSPSILDGKTEQDLNIMFQMFRICPFEILINLLSYNKQFCSSENVEKLYISLSSLTADFKDAFINSAQSIATKTTSYLNTQNKALLNTQNKDKDKLREINDKLISSTLSKTENFLLLLFTEKDIVFKLRLLTEAQNFTENYTQLNTRLNTFIELTKKLKGKLNFDVVVLSFNILYNKLNDKKSSGFLVDELKDKYDFGTNNHKIKIVDYILSELSDNKLVSTELHLNSSQSKSGKTINVNALKEELKAAKELITVDIGSALETLKEFSIINEQKIQNNTCAMFKNSLMEFMKENKTKLNELKTMENKVNAFVKEFVVKYKGGKNYSERTGKIDFEMVIGIMEGMMPFVDRYVNKVNKI
eukprot:GAHX01000193.1.p1 GENE.GAHX01000193.1~~GAHX01000193.1.p1  ORF type:complete len:835 (-),score=236.00 GAHX01000193.1:19-2523(-)